MVGQAMEDSAFFAVVRTMAAEDTNLEDAQEGDEEHDVNDQ
jgi:hypothetical protein